VTWLVNRAEVEFVILLFKVAVAPKSVLFIATSQILLRNNTPVLVENLLTIHLPKLPLLIIVLLYILELGDSKVLIIPSLVAPEILVEDQKLEEL
jgi:hypothetical protein